jgi:predicted HTH transcriptional regulator
LPPFHPAGEEGPAAYSGEAFKAAFPAETTLVEWKSGLGRKPLSEAIVAFSNTDGGVILLGVSDTGQGERGGAVYTIAADFAELTRARLDPEVAKESLLRLAEDQYLSNELVRETLHVDSGTARRLLLELVNEGKLVAAGRTRDRRYALPIE